ncbi:MAG: helix-turn-helix domain-containing protein [Candidatus Sigynarchaeota archaeon]
MKNLYPIKLDLAQRSHLETLKKRGKGSARFFKRVMILLACDDGKTYEEIQSGLGVSGTMIRNTRRKFNEGGLEAALGEKPRPGKPVQVTPDIEAKITALACEEPPAGRNTWTIKLLKSEMKGRFAISVGWGSIQRTLAGHELKPWKKRCGASRK